MTYQRRFSGRSLCAGLIAATAVCSPAMGQQFRAFWAACFHDGLASAEQVETMIGYAVQGRYNVIIMEVLAYQDANGSTSHGAFWKSDILPWAPAVTENFDPLEYVVERAHASGIEVDAWLIPYRVSTSWPPENNNTIPADGRWLMVPYADRGTNAKFDGAAYWLDPASPDVQEYLVSIVRELVTNYDIDGIHWDYETSGSGQDNWYYAKATYENSGVARFNRLVNGYPGAPPGPVPAIDNAAWRDFHRRAVTELHARCKVEIDAITSNPRQPLRHTSCVMPYDPVPQCTTLGYQGSSAYVYYNDYATWLRKGYIDAALPMVYKCGVGNSFNAWVDYFDTCYAYPAQCPRPIYIGQGTYMHNPKSDSLAQMQYAYNQGLQGVSNYCYAYTLGNGSCGTGTNDTTWWNYIATNLYTTSATIPAMPWRDPATATEGTLWGRVTSNGLPVDNATVSIPGLDPVYSDGNGYYVYTMLTATSGGTTYDVTGTDGVTQVTYDDVIIVAGTTTREDICLGTGTIISQHPQPTVIYLGDSASFTVAGSGEGVLTYQWQKLGVGWVNLNPGERYTGVAAATITIAPTVIGDTGSYRCVITGGCGSRSSNPAGLTVSTTTRITVQPCAIEGVCPGQEAVFTISAIGDGTISYRWQKQAGVGWSNLQNGAHYSGADTSILTVTGVNTFDAGNYRCTVNANSGVATSNAAALLLDPDSDGDGVADCLDVCPLSPQNDADSDGLCADADPCPRDPGNDADSDGLCASVDTCPLDGQNDVDGDGLCGDVDACPRDAENDADSDGVCGNVDACPGSSLAATIVIDDCESGVGNQLLPDGCSMADAIATAEASATSDAELYTEIGRLTATWEAASRISAADAARLRECAADSETLSNLPVRPGVANCGGGASPGILIAVTGLLWLAGRRR